MSEAPAKIIAMALSPTPFKSGDCVCCARDRADALKKAQAAITALKKAGYVVSAVSAEDGWQPIETAPAACHVLATRFEECEWMSAVVMSPPSKPFTHWMLLPASPNKKEPATT